MRSGLTQAELADRAGLSLRGLRDMETGRSNRPHLASIRRLAEVLDLSAEQRAPLLARVGAVVAENPIASATPGESSVGILGPLTVRLDGPQRHLGTPMLRRLLGLLALHAPGPAPIDRIMAGLWDGRPPRSARRQVHIRIGRLRRLLGAERVESVAGGYRLRGGLDASDFCDLVETAGRALAGGDRAGARDRYARALRLWRGPVLADVPGLRDHPAVAGLTARRIGATIAYAGLVEGADRPEGLRWLRELARAEPLHEGLAASLMLTLAAGGEQAAALATYDAIRATLLDELGIEPGPELRDTHLRVLRQNTPPEPTGVKAADRPVPAQLPPAVGGFVGRAPEVALLDAVLTDDDPDGGAGVAVVSGTAGVGKTTLAVWWAHRVACRFPDGQLYVNLRGFDPDGPALDPAEALRGFLDALAVPPERIPSGLDARTGLFRSLLHGRRVLVLVDNARDTAHVRPLLAGTATTVTVVTSRDRLGSLTATVGARLVGLDLLPPEEARALLARRLGRARIDAEPTAVAEIVDRCARLPLALAVVAAYAAGRPRFPLAAIARDLAAERSGTPAAMVADEVQTVLSWSYQALPPDGARLFRLLAVHPGPDIDAAAAASLLGMPAGDALLALVNAHLLTEHVPGRYAFHDLLRAYAGARAHAEESAADRDAAVRRSADHYLRSMAGADVALVPLSRRLPLPDAEPGVTPVAVGDRDGALGWLGVEYPVLRAVLRQADRARLDVHVWQLAWFLWRFFEYRGLLDDWFTVSGVAVDAARRLGDPVALERSHRAAAYAHARLHRYDEAMSHMDLAAAQHPALDDPSGYARVLLGQGWVTGLAGDRRTALGYAEHALAIFEGLVDRLGIMHALAGAGRHLIGMGDGDRALKVLTRAWAMHQDIEDQYGRADTLDWLGEAHLLRTEPETAARHFRQAAALHAELGDRYAEAGSYHRLGDAHEAMGDLTGAHAAWSSALRVFEDIGHDDALTVRRKLAPDGPAAESGRIRSDRRAR
jgi:DNA-binding SARP family transcriptional activator/tetratricopeptide (TPR) repeat protein